MALISNNPVEIEGKTYDKFATNLALSTLKKSDGFGISISVRLTPYLVGDDGIEILEDAAQSIVIGDAIGQSKGDSDIAEFLRAIEAAGQAFINAKGL